MNIGEKISVTIMMVVTIIISNIISSEVGIVFALLTLAMIKCYELNKTPNK